MGKQPECSCFNPDLCLSDLIHVADEVEHLVGEAPLVIVPGDELDEVAV